MIMLLFAVYESDCSGDGRVFSPRGPASDTSVPPARGQKCDGTLLGVFVVSAADPAVAGALQGLQAGPSDLLWSLHRSLQAFRVHGSDVAVAHRDAGGQDALNNAAARILGGLRNFLSLLRKCSPRRAFLTRCVVSQCPCEVPTGVDAEVFETARPLHFQLLDVQLMSTIISFVLSVLRFVVLTPCYETVCVGNCKAVSVPCMLEEKVKNAKLRRKSQRKGASNNICPNC